MSELLVIQVVCNGLSFGDKVSLDTMRRMRKELWGGLFAGGNFFSQTESVKIELPASEESVQRIEMALSYLNEIIEVMIKDNAVKAA